jgi:cell envelope-related function transcriptional attenuator common domain
MSDKESSQDDILKEISANIGKQISMELDKEKEKSVINDIESTAVQLPKKKSKKWIYILTSVVGVLCILAIAGVVIGNSMLDRIHYESDKDVKKLPTDKKTTNVSATTAPEAKSDKQVINILLIGEEAIHDDRGRSDSMMVATINRKQKTLKLTSFMRDCYVTIPGYLDNKLNAAYHDGGGPLLAATIEQNFGINIDGYVRVDFDGFEQIIDKLGGVDITLTSSEAHYLNTTNYISNPQYRTVREGKQTLNGNQALGYSRVRYREASDGEKDDFGRTSRQRTVLKAIYDKYKSKNVIQLLSITNDLLPLVTTNMTKNDILDYLTVAATLKSDELQTYRIPIDHTFQPQDVLIGSTKRNVLVIDKMKNAQALQQYIYGIGTTESADINENSSGSNTAQ